MLRQRSFSERVAEVMMKYTNSQLTSAEVMYALFELSQEVRADSDRGMRFSPPLSEDELAFYDAVADNESAVKVMGDEKLAAIARDLIRIMQRDVRTDWTVREDVKAKLRSSVKRLLRIHGYPPDQSDAAMALVLEQMEHLAPRFAKP